MVVPNSISISALIVFIFLPWQLEGLFCHRCLSISCPGDKELCTSSRDYIVQQLRKYYYIGNYLEPCPEPDNGIKWRELELYNDQTCEEENRGHATCTLGRLELFTIPAAAASTDKSSSSSKSSTVIYATVLGCAKSNLLKEMRDAKTANNCSYFENTNKFDRKYDEGYIHKLEIEHCPNLSDYCTVDFCVPPASSEVKPFKSQNTNGSFEFGTIITIIVIILVIFLAAIAAALCRFPISHVSNYSPAQAQEIESPTSTSTSARSITEVI